MLIKYAYINLTVGIPNIAIPFFFFSVIYIIHLLTGYLVPRNNLFHNYVRLICNYFRVSTCPPDPFGVSARDKTHNLKPKGKDNSCLIFQVILYRYEIVFIFD